MTSDSDTYHNNINLSPTGVSYNYSKEEIGEFIKCKADPVYFIENYVKVVHPDRGLEIMGLYDYQQDMVRSYYDNRKTISLTGRQMGKCFCINTLITIKHKDIYNGSPFTITVGQFYEWQAFIRRRNEILKV